MAKFVKGKSGNPKGRPKKTSNTPQIEFINLSHNVVRQAPRVDQTTRRNKPYVFFGTQNIFPQQLVKFYDNVNTHRQLVNKIVKYIVGEGWHFEGPQADAAQEWLEEATGGDSMKFLRKLAFDKYMFDGFYLNVLYQNDGFIDRLRHIDFTTIRSSLIDNETKSVNSYWFSVDWRQATHRTNFTDERTKIFEPKEIPAFDLSTFRDAENGQLWSVESVTGSAGKIYYPEPSYLGVLGWLDVGAKLSDFHRNNLDNGMSDNVHMHLYEDLSDPKKRAKVEEGISDKFAGSNNTGKIVVTWSTGEGKEPQITRIPNSNTFEMGRFLEETVTNEVIRAHNVPNILANIDVKTGLGGQAPAIRHSMSLFQAEVIQPRQTEIVNAINKILNINGFDAEVTIKDLIPFKFLVQDENLLFNVLGRERFMTDFLGIEPEEGDDVVTDDIDEQIEPE